MKENTIRRDLGFYLPSRLILACFLPFWLTHPSASRVNWQEAGDWGTSHPHLSYSDKCWLDGDGWICPFSEQEGPSQSSLSQGQMKSPKKQELPAEGAGYTASWPLAEHHLGLHHKNWVSSYSGLSTKGGTVSALKCLFTPERLFTDIHLVQNQLGPNLYRKICKNSEAWVKEALSHAGPSLSCFSNGFLAKSN